MFRRSIRLVLVIGIFSFFFLSIRPAQARRWMYGDNRFWAPLRICRDGAVLLAGDGDVDMEIEARLFPFNSLKPIPYFHWDYGSYASYPLDDYGPTISTPPTRTIVLEQRPYQLNTDRNSPFSFFGFQKFTWEHELQPASDRVVFVELEHGTGAASHVEDCRINQFYFAQAPVLGLGSERLDPGDNLLSPADLKYKLLIPPSNGLLRRNGTPLNAGDAFTQTDVDAGLVDYFPNGSLQNGDYFEYSLTGLRRISVSTTGVQGDGDSNQPSISADGSLVAFASFAQNLVSGPPDFFSDVYVRNIPESRTTRVSINNGGQQGNGDSYQPDISPDGAAVAFASQASNLVPGSTEVCEQAVDNNIHNDIYVRTNDPWQMYRYSVPNDCGDSDGDSYDPAVANGAQVVAFTSWATNFVSPQDYYNRDLYQHSQPPNGETTPLSVSISGGTGNGNVGPPSITNDGAYVAFASSADDLVPDDDNGGVTDVFVRGEGTTVMITRAPDGTGSNGYSYDPAISADGRFVVFTSYALNLADHYLPPQTQTIARIYVHDRDCDLDGIFDEFEESCTNYRDRTSLLPAGYSANSPYGGPGPDGSSYWPVISADGRFVAFASSANNLVDASPDSYVNVFVVDRDPDQNGLFENIVFRIVQASQPLPGSVINGDSVRPVISDDGRYVAFTSYASSLVPNDTNGASDVFLFYTGAREAFPIMTHMLYVPLAVK